jgi:hypothetical protein
MIAKAPDTMDAVKAHPTASPAAGWGDGSLLYGRCPGNIPCLNDEQLTVTGQDIFDLAPKAEETTDAF